MNSTAAVMVTLLVLGSAFGLLLYGAHCLEEVFKGFETKDEEDE